MEKTRLLSKANIANRRQKNPFNKLSKEIESISKKLDNKNFVDRAPKHIVEQEKNTYNELKSDIDKINLTIKSLK